MQETKKEKTLVHEKQTIIHKHTCENKFQDERYGAGMRVMNRVHDKMGSKARCTVCGEVIPI